MASPSSFNDRPGFRRSSSIVVASPRSLSYHERAGLDKSDADENVLYSTPSARIVKFTPSTAGISLTSAPIPHDTDYPVDTIETLPWRSTTETTLATGRLIIEKVRGSTNFLKCQTVMQAVMRNSQCWLVDGVSKFVLRVGKLQYYRIELPTSTEEEKKKVEDFQLALKPILRFEITPCPFKRGFHVELPEDAITPRRKGRWKRREGSLSSSPMNDRTQSRGNGRVWKSRTVSGLSGMETSPSRTDSGYGYRPDEEVPDLRIGKTRNIAPAMFESEESEEEGEEEDPEDDESEEIEGTSSDESMPSERPKSSLKDTTMDVAIKIHEDPSSSTEALTEEPTPMPVEELHPVEESEQSDEENDQDTEDEEKNPPKIHQMEAIEPVTSSSEDDLPIQTGEAFDTLEPSEDKAEAPQPELNSATEKILPTAELMEEKVKDDAHEPLAEDLTPVVDRDHLPEEEIDEETTENHEPSKDKEMTYAAIVEPRQGIDSEPMTDKILLTPGAKSPQEHEPQTNEEDDYAEEDVSSPGNRPKDTLSVTSSVDSFHTSTSIDEDFIRSSQAAAYFDGSTILGEPHDRWSSPVRSHKRDLSEITVTASSPEVMANEPGSPEMVSPSSPIIQEGLRNRLKSRRSLSPLPPSSNIFVPSQRQQGNHMTAALLQKACSLALVKPIEVVVLLVHILARIASGATVNDLMSGDLFKKPQPEHRRRSSNLPDQIDPRRDDGEEDDFGIPIRGRQRSNEPTRDDDEDSLLDLD